MAIPFSEFPEIEKFKKNPKNQNIEKRKKINPNLNSIWAFLSSIFIYIYVFYIFNLSPSTLIFTTKFWFFISNTLVLIIAVDFTAFASTKRRDFQDEHVIKDTTATSSKNNFIVSTYENHVIEDTTATSTKSVVSTYKKHMIKDTTATSPKGNAVVPFETMTSHDMKEEENPDENIINAVDGCHQKKRQKCERSNSENAVVAVAAVDEEGKAMVLHRTLSERHGREEQSLEDEKINEFSKISNEHLNKRVEEFIRRFNRQIRLQGVRNRQNLEMNKIH